MPSPALLVRTAARQLPPGPVDFVNRTCEMSTLDDILGDSVGGGEAGSGEAGSGGGEAGSGVGGEALTSFLTAMGVPSSALPTSFAGRLSLYRTLSAEDPMLVVVHGPTLPAQVTPLIPTAAGSLVLVSAQQDVGGPAMDGARFIDVGPLDRQAALALLAAGCGSDRIDADPAAAERLVESCGRLAIAVRVVASRLHLEPTMTVAELADEVAAESYILDAMSLPDGSRAVELPFTNAYRYLTADGRRLYRDLGVLPVGEVSDELLARVGWPDRTVRRAAIDELPCTPRGRGSTPSTTTATRRAPTPPSAPHTCTSATIGRPTTSSPRQPPTSPPPSCGITRPTYAKISPAPRPPWATEPRPMSTPDEPPTSDACQTPSVDRTAATMTPCPVRTRHRPSVSRRARASA